MIIGVERSDGGLTVITLVDGFPVENIPAEIDHHLAGAGQGWTCVRWEELEDYPPREDRNAYELGEDGTCVLNPDKVPPDEVEGKL